jgi:hypothetical protein
MNIPAQPTIGTTLRYWCGNCDQSFGLMEVSEQMPACAKNEWHKLVPIDVEYNPDDEALRSDADFGEGD